jgi:hypothetical protein
MRIKEIYFQLKSKLQIIEEENLNEEGEEAILDTERQNDVTKLRDRISHYWGLVSTFLRVKKILKSPSVSHLKKRKKLGSSQRIKRGVSLILENQAKKRNNRLISQANNLFNSVL